MPEGTRLFFIFLSAMLVNNFVLARFLGICPFLGVSKKVDTAVGMSIAVIFVMVMASIITWILNLLLVVFSVSFLRTVVFILIIASLVQFVEIFLKKISPSLYDALGIYLPLITTNCAILGLALLNVQQEYSLMETIIHAVGAGFGFALALIIFSTVRERMELYEVPESFKGTASALVSAGLLSMAFMGFQGLVKL